MRHRLETQTPNRMNLGNNNDDSDSIAGEFRRSASARLHRNKRNYPSDLFNNSAMDDESRKKEQVRKLKHN